MNRLVERELLAVMAAKITERIHQNDHPKRLSEPKGRRTLRLPEGFTGRDLQNVKELEREMKNQKNGRL